jgi:hypothetical protein
MSALYSRAPVFSRHVSLGSFRADFAGSRHPQFTYEKLQEAREILFERFYTENEVAFLRRMPRELLEIDIKTKGGRFVIDAWSRKDYPFMTDTEELIINSFRDNERFGVMWSQCDPLIYVELVKKFFMPGSTKWISPVGLDNLGLFHPRRRVYNSFILARPACLPNLPLSLLELDVMSSEFEMSYTPDDHPNLSPLEHKFIQVFRDNDIFASVARLPREEPVDSDVLIGSFGNPPSRKEDAINEAYWIAVWVRRLFMQAPFSEKNSTR